MSGILEDLAEARIRDWQRRVASGESRADKPPLETDRLENQLFKEILVIYERARSCEGDQRSALMAQANKLRMQLLIGLEKTNPLAAQQLDDRLAQARPHSR